MRRSGRVISSSGPHLHWDVSVKTPIPLGTGGILYLTDTPPEQGAFTLVPGFQRWGEAWLKCPAARRRPAAAGSLRVEPARHRRPRRRSRHLASGACPTAPVPTAAPGRAWCNTSTCSRPGSRNMRSGFNQARRRGALNGSRSNKNRTARLRALDGQKPQLGQRRRPSAEKPPTCRRRPARDDRGTMIGIGFCPSA